MLKTKRLRVTQIERKAPAFWAWGYKRGLESQVAAKYNAEIMLLELLPDHVHLLGKIDPQFRIHRLGKNIKGVSSHPLRKEFSMLRSRIPSLWTNRHLVSTMGGAPLAVIQPYMES